MHPGVCEETEEKRIPLRFQQREGKESFKNPDPAREAALPVNALATKG